MLVPARLTRLVTRQTLISGRVKRRVTFMLSLFAKFLKIPFTLKTQIRTPFSISGHQMVNQFWPVQKSVTHTETVTSLGRCRWPVLRATVRASCRLAPVLFKILVTVNVTRSNAKPLNRFRVVAKNVPFRLLKIARRVRGTGIWL